MPLGLSNSLALSPVPGATNTCYQALTSSRRPRGRGFEQGESLSSLINSYRSKSQKVVPVKARSRHWIESSYDIQFERMAALVDMVTEWSDGSVRPSGQAWSVPGL